MKFSNSFEQFLRDYVNLNQSRIDLLSKRVKSIEAFILDSVLGEKIVDFIPAGSWAHRTIIHPKGRPLIFDADVMVHIEKQDEWEPKDYIDQLYKIFRENDVYKNIVKKETRCVRINYTGEFHIDLVPFFDEDGGHIVNRLVPENIGSIEPSKPEEFSEWVNDMQCLTNGNFIKVVRLWKYLRDHKEMFTCRSIILKTLLGECVKKTILAHGEESFKDLPTSLVTLSSCLTESLPKEMPPVMDPGETGDDFTERVKDSWNYKNFREQVVFYSDKMLAAFEEDDPEKSFQLWQEVFGEDLKRKKKSQNVPSNRSSDVCANEQFINAGEYNFSMRLNKGVKITATVLGNNTKTGRKKKQYVLANQGCIVEKGRKILFKADTDFEGDYVLYWKVRNGGSEADELKALRGEITIDNGDNLKEESTSYAGYHYVECYVVKGGTVVARTRHDVIVPKS